MPVSVKKEEGFLEKLVHRVEGEPEAPPPPPPAPKKEGFLEGLVHRGREREREDESGSAPTETKQTKDPGEMVSGLLNKLSLHEEPKPEPKKGLLGGIGEKVSSRILCPQVVMKEAVAERLIA